MGASLNSGLANSGESVRQFGKMVLPSARAALDPTRAEAGSPLFDVKARKISANVFPANCLDVTKVGPQRMLLKQPLAPRQHNRSRRYSDGSLRLARRRVNFFTARNAYLVSI
jgi:hypothetical protein